MRELYITDTAQADIDDIWWTIAEDNLSAADTLLDRLHETLGLLLDQPAMGVARPDLGKELRSFVWHPRYLVFYQFWRDGIVVVRVLHGARDLHALEFPPP